MLSEDQVTALEAHLAGTLDRTPPLDVVQRLRASEFVSLSRKKSFRVFGIGRECLLSWVE